MSSANRDAGRTSPGDLDEEQATALVRRSAESSRGQESVSAAAAGLEEAAEDDHVVVEVERWSEPRRTDEELGELEARRQAAEASAAAATERVIAQAVATGMTDPDEQPEVRRGFLRRKSGYYSPAAARATRPQPAEHAAPEPADQVAAAHQARAKAEEAALRAALEREAAEADARAAVEATAEALAARVAAETRARDLAASLEEARAALAAEQARASAPAAAAPAPVRAPAPAAPVAPAAPAQQATPRAKPAARQPEPRIAPEGVPDVVEFRSPSSSAVVTVLLGIGALVAAGAAVYQAYLDQLTTTPGIVASAITLVLAIAVGRSKGGAGRVWLEQGVLHVDDGDSHRRFDLTTPNTKVEMVGEPGDRRWKVLFLRKGMAPYEVNARLVDPEPFFDALRPWRPRLGG